VVSLFVTVGLPGAGKTTRAKELASQYSALRLTPDAWMIPLFGESDADGKRDVLEGRLIWLALEALKVGTNVVLDFEPAVLRGDDSVLGPRGDPHGSGPPLHKRQTDAPGVDEERLLEAADELEDVMLPPPIKRFLARWQPGDPAVYLGALWAR